MKRATYFSVSSNCKVLLDDIGLDVAAVLAHARLPVDLLSHADSRLLPMEFFRLWQSIDAVLGEEDFPLLLAQHFSIEAFDVPVFASICSPDLNTALARIRHYKPLIGPMEMDLDITDKETSVVMRCYGYTGDLPVSFGLSEVVFFTQLARLATRKKVSPSRVLLPELPSKKQEAYQDYFGCPLVKGENIEIRFSAQDATRPFLTSNSAMWQYFEGSLNKKLNDLTLNASTGERVRSVLIELLPAGISSIDVTAEKLSMSKRTLQRKLTQEAESYHAILQSVRSELADHYLRKSTLSLGEISFLLGFQETSSFIRAFSGWNGVSPSVYRDIQ